jgi:ubiquinone/menaquinone biosynthesis C-methylase UbiE
MSLLVRRRNPLVILAMLLWPSPNASLQYHTRAISIVKPFLLSSHTTMSTSENEKNQPDQWSAQAELYSNQAARLTELHGADLIAILKDDILKAKIILDVGCGTGAFAKAYVNQFPQGIPGQTLILSDLSEGMLDKAKETVVCKDDFQTKLLFQVEDGTKLDGIADDSVDIVVSLFGVFLFPDQQGALQAISRVLKNGSSNAFANASWMFGVSDYFSNQGFGVSLQDAFKVPNDILHPSSKSIDDVMKWSTPHDIRRHLAVHVDDSIQDNVRCFPAIHNTVWEFDNLWTMMSNNPMSAIPRSSPEDVAKAKTALQDFVTNNGQSSLEEPIMLSTASILTTVRGFRYKSDIPNKNQ